MSRVSKLLEDLDLKKSDAVLRATLEAIQGLAVMSTFKADDWKQIVDAVQHVFLKYNRNTTSGVYETAGETLEVIRDAGSSIPAAQKMRAMRILTGAEWKHPDIIIAET